MRLDVLGPTQTGRADGSLDLRPRERDVVTALALSPALPMSVDDLADAVWAGAAPASAAVTIQNHVSRIRRSAGRSAVATGGAGYCLGPSWSLDYDRRDVLVAQAARWRRVGRADLAVEALDGASALDRGPAFADLGESALVGAERMRHRSVARSIEDDLLVALLLVGATTRVAVEGEALASAEPFREVRWAALAVALYRDGQRREAVRALRRGQEGLRERVGLDAGPVLQRLESLVFDDDPVLLDGSPTELLGRFEAGDVLPAGRRASGAPVGGHASVDELAGAARTALDDLRFADAAELWRLAADLSAEQEGPEAVVTLDLRLDQAEALSLAGDPSCAAVVQDAAGRAERAGGDVFGRAAGALCRLGPFTAPGPRNDDIAAAVERAVAGVRSVETRSACHCEAALFYSLTGDVDLANEHYERSLVDARAAGDPRLVLDALSATYAIVTHPSDQSRRSALAAEMLAIAERTDDDDGRFTALHLYFALQVIDADPLLRTTFRHQEALARSLRAAARRWMVAYQRACLAYLDGRFDLALEIAEDAFATAPVAPSRATIAYGMQVLLVRVAQGRGQELAELVDAAIAEQPEITGWRAVAAWLASQRGDRARVAEELLALDDGKALALDMSWGGAVMILARAAAAVGIIEPLPALADLLRPYSGQFTWYGAGTVGPYDLALAEVALALDDRRAAEHHLASAQRSVTALGARVFQPDLDAVAVALAP